MTEVRPAEDTQPRSPESSGRTKGGLVGGLVLIVLGLLFLADNLFPQFNFSDYWPLILVAVGVGLLWKSAR